MLEEKELQTIKNKIENKISLEIDEISKYLNIEERLIKNIFVMYKAFGRKSVESITLSNEEIDDVIKLGCPEEKRLVD